MPAVVGPQGIGLAVAGEVEAVVDVEPQAATCSQSYAGGDTRSGDVGAHAEPRDKKGADCVADRHYPRFSSALFYTNREIRGKRKNSLRMREVSAVDTIGVAGARLGAGPGGRMFGCLSGSVLEPHHNSLPQRDQGGLDFGRLRVVLWIEHAPDDRLAYPKSFGEICIV